MQQQIITLINGNSTLSSFRLAKLQQFLNSNSLTSNEVYFILSKQKLSLNTLHRLEQLLNGNTVPEIDINQCKAVVTPRFGTISPWSSKATEIAQRCGLSEVTRIEKAIYYKSDKNLDIIYDKIHDRMTESIITHQAQIEQLFTSNEGATYSKIDILTKGKGALETANQQMGLALSPDEIDYLFSNYTTINKNITDIELMMFAQANSEHCRHKIFNAEFIINGHNQDKTLFQMIKDTYKNAPQNILVAYDDNSSVITGGEFKAFYPEFNSKEYKFNQETNHVIMKVETHNHPTAIEPFAGAATGSGGEIRDEGATGRGSKPKAGLCGFSVSNLNLDNSNSDYGKPQHVQSALNIMLQGPIGAASFNNEFGRPNLCGYFRSFEEEVGGFRYGYHKPIMLAGGYGTINEKQVVKLKLSQGALIIQIGGPGFLIGLGGGSASSMTGGENKQELDFNSVQRSNPEIERRCQEVINSCCSLGSENPILSIHDVGAGGLSNAVPELVHGSGIGGKFELRSIPSFDNSMSPLEIWCNESQERYVMAINPENLEIFKNICERENCPFAVLGHAVQDKQLTLTDARYKNTPIDINIDTLLGKPPRTIKDVEYYSEAPITGLITKGLKVDEALYKVISHPTVASKSFLITIGDRSVGGNTVRDQMVGKWQIPIADCAITAFGLKEKAGEVMAMGERTPVAILNAPASGRMAIAESLTNLSGAAIKDINDIKLSANWMASCGSPNQDALLYHTVTAVSELCQTLNIAIPVGKDSLSMKMKWNDGSQAKSVTSPVSLIISAFATIADVTHHFTPELVANEKTRIILVSLNDKQRMGASILQECYHQIGGDTPDVDNALQLKNLFALLQQIRIYTHAYHDKSDGGLITALCEMIFSSRIGITLNLMEDNLIDFLYNEEIGVALQVAENRVNEIISLAETLDLTVQNIGTINLQQDKLAVYNKEKLILQEPRLKLQQAWGNVSYTMQKLRDNPVCADSELKLLDSKNTGLFAKLTFDIKQIQRQSLHLNRPKIAILREQGVNGHVEMAASFVKAGFSAIDVHLNDILSGRISLAGFSGIAVCGGFSYGDVLGAGLGFANSILFNTKLKDEFSAFFNRPDTFGLGICNGCQVMAHLAEIIPGATNFPRFTKNISEQFEARVVMAEIPKSPSVLLKGMHGSQIPIIVSHGEGYANFKHESHLAGVDIALQYIDNSGKISETYPYNPNGSPRGIAGVCNSDGRFTILMPHPERTFRTQQMSWHDKTWGEMGPWFKLFLNAREFIK